MRPHAVVIFDPASGQYCRLKEIAEQLAVEEFVPHPGVEALAIPIFPRAAWFDIRRDDANIGQPLSQLVRREFAPVVAAQILGAALGDHQPRKNFDDIVISPAPAGYRRQAFMRELVDDIEKSDFFPDSMPVLIVPDFLYGTAVRTSWIEEIIQ